MAVEAHRLLLAGGHRQQQQQQLASAGWPWAGADEDRCATTARPSQHHHHQQQQQQQQELRLHNASCVGVLAPRVSTIAAGGQMFLGDAAESDVTFGGGGAAARQEVTAVAPAPKRRKRAEQQQTPPVFQVCAADDVAAQFQQHIVDVNRLVFQQTANLWAALTELRRRQARQVVAAVEAAAATRLRAREEEVQRTARINGTLEERARSLYVEAQLWRDLARANEATANELRAELQQALDDQRTRGAPGAGADADDAGSCCRGGEDCETGTSLARTCAVCGLSAADVLLLPCRHLCACAPCAGAARACPACGCAKNGSVCVNFS